MLFGGNKNGNGFCNNSLNINNQQQTNNGTSSFPSSSGSSGLHLSLNYNELTNMQYPQTYNGNNMFSSSPHATNSINIHKTCYDNNFIRSNNQHQENMISPLDFSNMFNVQNNNSSNMNNCNMRNGNQISNNFHMNQNSQQHVNFNVVPQNSMTGQYEPLVQSFSNPFQLGSANQRVSEPSLALEDTCISQFCSTEALNKRKQTLSDFQLQSNNSISNTIECSSSISPQPFIENSQNAMNLVENSFNTHLGTTNKMQSSFPHNNNCYLNNNSNDMHFGGEHCFDPSDDASSNEHVSSPKSGGKERVVASSVGKKVNGRYTKLRKQLRTFGGDFTDNYFVLDISTAGEKRPIKGGKKRKSSPTENESEEEILHNNRNHRSYTIHSSDYNNNIKIIPDMQNTSDECVIDMDSRRRSSIGPISQSSTNPVIMIDSVNNNSFNPPPSLIISNDSMSRPYSTPNNTISPRSSNSRDITPQEVEQTDNRSVQILLSLLMNSVNQQQATKEISINNESVPPQSNPQFNFNVNTRSQSLTPQNFANNEDFSFLNMLMRQNNNKQ
ncbi:predicted protein [Naegleria gruberi]|uniref:Predicted protein n=1 Tax=Naegleria gruberi TaxID=5762 RepID=D2VN64_NAEGR|nr:uncharacterized protein NAEGRDRAFT_70385 [Naegleria gruberi]EFC41596.1 predicted protein [Naegleria gruberi]|eukprot:XP_002674340.1 predicted protein [Naegleria gruberi strain NEG-M]